jgi:hypothetical protein
VQTPLKKTRLAGFFMFGKKSCEATQSRCHESIAGGIELLQSAILKI